MLGMRLTVIDAVLEFDPRVQTRLKVVFCVIGLDETFVPLIALDENPLVPVSEQDFELPPSQVRSTDSPLRTSVVLAENVRLLCGGVGALEQL